MIPESELVLNEYTIRRLALPSETKLTKPSMMRWFCLSLGLISPGESRQAAFDFYDALFYYLFTLKRNPSTKEILDYVKSKTPTNTGTEPPLLSEKLARHHLNKLIDLGLVVRKHNLYYFAQPPEAQQGDFAALFDQVIAENVKKSIGASRDMFGELSKNYSKQ